MSDRLPVGVFVDSYTTPVEFSLVQMRLPAEAVAADTGYPDLSLEVRRNADGTVEVVLFTDNVAGDINLSLVDGRGVDHSIMRRTR